MRKYIPIEKMSKKAQKVYYAKSRGVAIPPQRVGKGTHAYKTAKYNLKGV